ncbi:MAG TPA: CBS domain-containing protein [Rhodopila sp.]|nr:CBS domain-containing protein [Rhodopila sp.]
MRVDTLLKRRRPRIISVRMNETVGSAAQILRRENVGAVLVKDSCGTEGDIVVGLLSERDFLRALTDYGVAAFKMPVSAVMTRTVVACELSDSIDTVAELMQRHHIRYVPVIDCGALIGVVSIRDLLAEGRTVPNEPFSAAA